MTKVYISGLAYRAPDRIDARRGLFSPSEDTEAWMRVHRSIGVQPDVLAHYLEVYVGEMRWSYKNRRAEWDAILAADTVTLVCDCEDFTTCHLVPLGKYVLHKLGAEFMGERVLRRREDLADHRCHALGCETKVPPERLMCPRHWRMVPRDVQREVWQWYREGQCYDLQVSAEYLDAARRAVACVAQVEGRDAVPDAIRAFDADVAKIELPGEGVWVWRRHRVPLRSLEHRDREEAWQRVCAKVGAVAGMAKPHVWLKRAVAEADALERAVDEADALDIGTR